jgi:rare lipoprotein A (peptidoglycan hydrolase)
VWFAGDRLNARVTRDAGRLVVFREALASWYEDGGATACGFHAALGVAHRWLPCGTRVTFRYRGREITAVVDDRGPFGSSREWDLSQRTAGALGFEGVAPVWSTS